MVLKTLNPLICFSTDKIYCWGGNNEYNQIDEPQYIHDDKVIKFNEIKKLIMMVQVGDEFTCVEYYNYHLNFKRYDGNLKDGQHNSNF